MTEILSADTFVCHKTLQAERLQCAGHMIIKGQSNAFVRIAGQLNISLRLTGRELIFGSDQECINHHSKDLP